MSFLFQPQGGNLEKLFKSGTSVWNAEVFICSNVRHSNDKMILKTQMSHAVCQAIMAGVQWSYVGF